MSEQATEPWLDRWSGSRWAFFLPGTLVVAVVGILLVLFPAYLWLILLAGILGGGLLNGPYWMYRLTSVAPPRWTTLVNSLGLALAMGTVLAWFVWQCCVPLLVSFVVGMDVRLLLAR